MKPMLAGLAGLLVGAAAGAGGYAVAGGPAAPSVAPPADAALARIELKAVRLPVSDPQGAIVATILVDAALLLPESARAGAEAATPFIRHELTLAGWSTPLTADTRGASIDMAKAAALIHAAANRAAAGAVRRVVIVDAVLG